MRPHPSPLAVNVGAWARHLGLAALALVLAGTAQAAPRHMPDIPNKIRGAGPGMVVAVGYSGTLAVGDLSGLTTQDTGTLQPLFGAYFAGNGFAFTVGSAGVLLAKRP